VGTTTNATVESRVRKLSTAAGRRIIEPDEDVAGAVGDGQVIPDELLSIAGLDLDLTPEQRRTLSREETASIVQAGIRFEAVLEAGFAAQVAKAKDMTDPRLTFILHEVGEETRHQRLFQRLVTQLEPQAKPPIPHWLMKAGIGLTIHAVTVFPAFLYTLVLGGEEIPDLFQKRASEHPDTDPFIREVNKYHRLEEARHLSYARAVLPELWEQARPVDRVLVKRVAPLVIRGMFDEIVHPGVYGTVGLPPFRTWRAASHTPTRRQMRYDATRPVLQALIDAEAIKPGRVPRPWRSLCNVDRAGAPRPVA
jgi:hypothetical protein